MLTGLQTAVPCVKDGFATPGTGGFPQGREAGVHLPRRHILPRKEGGFIVVSTSPISSSILSKSWVCLSQDFLGALKSFVAYLISKAIGFSRYAAKLWSLHHIPGCRIL
jgi:hypothetical protein